MLNLGYGYTALSEEMKFSKTSAAVLLVHLISTLASLWF